MGFIFSLHVAQETSSILLLLREKSLQGCGKVTRPCLPDTTLTFTEQIYVMDSGTLFEVSNITVLPVDIQ